MKAEIAVERVNEAYKIKELRSLCGLTQIVVATKFNIEQGNYSRMERGMLRMPQEVKDYIISEFKLWRMKKIDDLRLEFEYLNNLI